ncbi:hypothetical protein [Cellvibrio zantedeschiae]|uniref:hypothetical protein n=1 Tax=Cellvibrio zantedeschiae TaxID=1237077 RepID=UPI001676AD6C|nr:hypothetical protein [Cellvibrio zantedeschiae]
MTTENNKNIQNLSRTKKIIAGCLWGAGGYLFYGLSKIIPQFQETFNSFGVQLPTLTNISLTLAPSYKLIAYFCIVPVLFIFGLGEFSFKGQRLYFKITLIAFFSMVFYFFLSLISLYLPIFTLGQVV